MEYKHMSEDNNMFLSVYLALSREHSVYSRMSTALRALGMIPHANTGGSCRNTVVILNLNCRVFLHSTLYYVVLFEYTLSNLNPVAVIHMMVTYKVDLGMGKTRQNHWVILTGLVFFFFFFVDLD